MIGIIDYGVGNLHSVKNALDYLKCECIISSKIDDLSKCDKLILPGVGAFGDGIKLLEEKGLDLFVKDFALTGKPLLGICLGMQLLFEKSYEKGEHEGLSLIPGTINKIIVSDLKVPHMGWNCLSINNENLLTNGLSDLDYVYFVHSYMAFTEEKYINAYTDYQIKIPAMVSNGNIYGCQFHPEKSDEIGMKILRNFIDL